MKQKYEKLKQILFSLSWCLLIFIDFCHVSKTVKADSITTQVGQHVENAISPFQVYSKFVSNEIENFEQFRNLQGQQRRSSQSLSGQEKVFNSDPRHQQTNSPKSYHSTSAKLPKQETATESKTFHQQNLSKTQQNSADLSGSRHSVQLSLRSLQPQEKAQHGSSKKGSIDWTQVVAEKYGEVTLENFESLPNLPIKLIKKLRKQKRIKARTAKREARIREQERRRQERKDRDRLNRKNEKSKKNKDQTRESALKTLSTNLQANKLPTIYNSSSPYHGCFFTDPTFINYMNSLEIQHRNSAILTRCDADFNSDVNHLRVYPEISPIGLNSQDLDEPMYRTHGNNRILKRFCTFNCRSGFVIAKHGTTPKFYQNRPKITCRCQPKEYAAHDMFRMPCQWKVPNSMYRQNYSCIPDTILDTLVEHEMYLESRKEEEMLDKIDQQEYFQGCGMSRFFFDFC